MAGIQDFANPRSMITPGIAGGITMFITNALGTQFELPLNWVGLAISFVLGLIVFSSSISTGFERIVLYFVNSMIIFATAFGTNVAATRSFAPGAAAVASVSVPSAPAPPSVGTSVVAARVHEAEVAVNQAQQRLRETQDVYQKATAAKSPGAPSPPAPVTPPKTFFREWSASLPTGRES